MHPGILTTLLRPGRIWRLACHISAFVVECVTVPSQAHFEFGQTGPIDIPLGTDCMHMSDMRVCLRVWVYVCWFLGSLPPRRLNPWDSSIHRILS